MLQGGKYCAVFAADLRDFDLLGVGLVVAAIFGILAAKDLADGDEHEALTIRHRALHEARSSLALGALIPVAGTLLRSRRNDLGRNHFGGGSDNAAPENTERPGRHGAGSTVVDRPDHFARQLLSGLNPRPGCW